MINNDPHGLILTLIAVTTVFTCLIVLCLAYTLLGKYFTRKAKTDASPAEKPAPESSDEKEIAAAIAAAIELYGLENESGKVITFAPDNGPVWADPCKSFRHNPNIR